MGNCSTPLQQTQPTSAPRPTDPPPRVFWPDAIRVNGIVAVLTACLVLLFVSYVFTVLCGHTPKHGGGGISVADGGLDGLARKGRNLPAGGIEGAGGYGPGAAASSSQRGGGLQRQNPPVSSAKIERGGSGVDGLGHACIGGGGAWERWACWSSAERHACAAVVVSGFWYGTVRCGTVRYAVS